VVFRELLIMFQMSNFAINFKIESRILMVLNHLLVVDLLK